MFLIIHADERLTLGTSAFCTFHGGNSTLINSFDDTKFSCFTLPAAQLSTTVGLTSFYHNAHWLHSI